MLAWLLHKYPPNLLHFIGYVFDRMKFVYILNGKNGSPSFLWRRKLIWVRGENEIEIHSVENSNMARNINSNRLIFQSDQCIGWPKKGRKSKSRCWLFVKERVNLARIFLLHRLVISLERHKQLIAGPSSLHLMTRWSHLITINVTCLVSSLWLNLCSSC